MRMSVQFCALLLTLTIAVQAECAAVGAQTQKQPAAAPASAAPAKVANPVADMQFVLIKGGCFEMGDVAGDGLADERPVREVCVADFQLGKFEVTQSQWQKVMGENPSAFKQCGADCPVDSVSWDMAQEFIRKLNAISGKKYRLPTEAEWEYAARSGGKKEKWPGTSDESSLEEFAWVDKNSNAMTHKVGLKKANGLGLYDMAGNVKEWCQDWYGEHYYEKSPRNNPAGPEVGESRVMRGGDWETDGGYGRVSRRDKDSPDNNAILHGLRLVLPVK